MTAIAGRPSTGYGPGTSVMLLAPILVLMGLGFFYPLIDLLVSGLFNPGFTLENYDNLGFGSLFFSALMRTFRISVIVTAGTLLLSYPLAMWMSRSEGWKLNVMMACLLMPLWISVLVRSYAWVVLLQRNGLINQALKGLGLIERPLPLLYNEFAVSVAMIHVLLPFMVLPIYAALKNIPRELEQAALNLGAGGWRVLRHVTLPLSLPGVAAGMVIVFILALGFFVTPALVGGPQSLMVATLIGSKVTSDLDWGVASAMATILLALTLLVVTVFNRTLDLERTEGGA